MFCVLLLSLQASNQNSYNFYYKISIKTSARNSTQCVVSIPGSNVDRHEVVEVKFAPFLYVCGKGCAEENPADFGRRAGQEDGGKLLSETPLPILKELIRLIHHQPLHTTHSKHTFMLERKLLIFCV